MITKVSSVSAATTTHSEKVPQQQKVEKKTKNEDKSFSEIIKNYSNNA